MGKVLNQQNTDGRIDWLIRHTSLYFTELQCVKNELYRNLVSYLKQKEAAGVITLSNPQTDQTGVLYAFPPCPFRWAFTTSLPVRENRNDLFYPEIEITKTKNPYASLWILWLDCNSTADKIYRFLPKLSWLPSPIF